MEPKGNKTKKCAVSGMLLILILAAVFLMWNKEKKDLDLPKKEQKQTGLTEKQQENGYALPVEEKKRQQAEEEIKEAMEEAEKIVQQAKQNHTNGDVIPETDRLQIKEILKRNGKTVTGAEPYAVMENYEEMDRFLQNCQKGKAGTTVLYYVKAGGGLNRMEYEFDGTNLFVLETIAEWNEEGEAVLTGTTRTRARNWMYTEKGWFGYELCAPQPPEVSEVVDASTMFRVRPLDETCRELSRKCVLVPGYQGNNLLCSDWDEDHLSDLDYNGLFESLYEMKYGEIMDGDAYAEGIPQEEFETLMMEYLPVTREELRTWAEYDRETGTYLWVRLGTGNYSPTVFGTSLPEVTAVEEQGDETVVLTVEAVCTAACNDQILTHKLTVRFRDDGTFQYLGNEIGQEDLAKIPQYQYRFGRQWNQEGSE